MLDSGVAAGREAVGMNKATREGGCGPKRGSCFSDTSKAASRTVRGVFPTKRLNNRTGGSIFVAQASFEYCSFAELASELGYFLLFVLIFWSN